MIAVVQPHRFTRLRDLMDEFQTCFNDADMVFAAPVYPAGEAPIAGRRQRSAGRGAQGARASLGRRQSPGRRELAETLAESLQAGDMVVCLGAGDITKWAAGPWRGAARSIRCNRARAGMNRAPYSDIDEAVISQLPIKTCAASSPRMRRWRRWSGSRPAARRTGCSNPRILPT